MTLSRRFPRPAVPPSVRPHCCWHVHAAPLSKTFAALIICRTHDAAVQLIISPADGFHYPKALVADVCLPACRLFQTLTQSADITMTPRLAFVAALCCLAASRLTAVSAQTTTGQVGSRSMFATQILN